MENTPADKNAFQSLRDWSANSVTLKVLSIGALVLLMLIPLNMAESIIRERMYRGLTVSDEIAAEWATAQTLVGPVLRIPYNQIQKTERIQDGKSITELTEVRKAAYFLPTSLNISASLDPDTKYRGIYSVPIYTADIAYSGSFKKPDFDGWKEDKSILWNEAELIFGLSDKKGLQDVLMVTWNKESTRAQTHRDEEVLGSFGISAPVVIGPDLLESRFSFNTKLRGSKSLYIAPTSAETVVNIKSTWADPAFRGAFLPDPTVPGVNGFDASWKVTDLNHGFPLSFNEPVLLNAHTFGVELFEPMNVYTLSERAVKYGILVIVLTFSAFFFIQIMTGKRIHFIQYLLVGLALSIFYVLLLSLAEVWEFKMAYLTSSLAVLLLSGYYMVNILGRLKSGLRTNLIVAAVYVFVFVIIQMEEFALLAGSIGLFAVLTLVMTLTRKVDWYRMKKKE